MTVRLPELLILRHGETVWNRAGRLQGRLDSDLTDLGRAQAARQGAILRWLGVTATGHELVSSPQGRAAATAAIAFEPIGGPVREDARLVEIDVGEITGRTLDEARALWPATFADPTPFAWYFRAPGGESFAALRDRAAAFLATLDRPTVIVTHGITSRVLRGLALGLDRAGMFALDGGQGVVYRIADGRQERLTAEACTAPPARAMRRPAGD